MRSKTIRLALALLFVFTAAFTAVVMTSISAQAANCCTIYDAGSGCWFPGKITGGGKCVQVNFHDACYTPPLCGP